MSVAKDFISALRATQKKTKPADDDAVVRRIEGNTAWVHIPGGVDETPVQMTINCEIGETVKVRRADGRAWIVGNGTAPPTDDKRAIRAEIKAIEASRTASDYITDTQNGVFVHPADDATSGWKIADAIELLKHGVSYIWAGLVDGLATVRVGRLDSGHTSIDSNGMRVYGGDGSEQLAHIGYGETIDDDGQTVLSRYFTFGRRYGAVGSMSVVEGSSIASGVFSHAEGAFAQAEGGYSHAENITTRAVGLGSHAQGFGTIASKSSQTALGTYNVEDTAGTTTHPNGDASYGQYAVIVGNGRENGGILVPSNALTVDWSGNVDAAGGYTVGGKPLIKIREVLADNVSVPKYANNAYSQQSITLTSSSDYDGYTPVGVVGWLVGNASSGGSAASWVHPYQVFLDTSTATPAVKFYVRNHYTDGAAKVKLTAKVLYVSNGIV